MRLRIDVLIWSTIELVIAADNEQASILGHLRENQRSRRHEFRFLCRGREEILEMHRPVVLSAQYGAELLVAPTGMLIVRCEQITLADPHDRARVCASRIMPVAASALSVRFRLASMNQGCSCSLVPMYQRPR